MFWYQDLLLSVSQSIVFRSRSVVLVSRSVVWRSRLLWIVLVSQSIVFRSRLVVWWPRPVVLVSRPVVLVSRPVVFFLNKGSIQSDDYKLREDIYISKLVTSNTTRLAEYPSPGIELFVDCFCHQHWSINLGIEQLCATNTHFCTYDIERWNGSAVFLYKAAAFKWHSFNWISGSEVKCHDVSKNQFQLILWSFAEAVKTLCKKKEFIVLVFIMTQ